MNQQDFQGQFSMSISLPLLVSLVLPLFIGCAQQTISSADTPVEPLMIHDSSVCSGLCDQGQQSDNSVDKDMTSVTDDSPDMALMPHDVEVDDATHPECDGSSCECEDEECSEPPECDENRLCPEGFECQGELNTARCVDVDECENPERCRAPFECLIRLIPSPVFASRRPAKIWVRSAG